MQSIHYLMRKSYLGKLIKNKKISKKLLTNQKKYGIIIIQTKERGKQK